MGAGVGDVDVGASVYVVLLLYVATLHGQLLLRFAWSPVALRVLERHICQILDKL